MHEAHGSGYCVFHLRSANVPQQPEKEVAPITTQPTAVAASMLAQNQALAEAFVNQPPRELQKETDPLADLEATRKRVAVAEKKLLKEELKLKQQQQEEFLAARREKRKVRPIRAARTSTALDRTVIMDDDGRPAGDPKMHKRIVRLVDGNERPSNSRAGEMKHWGYEPVKSRVTGKPIVSEFGMLMQCSPEAEAARRVYHEKDLVAQNGSLDDREEELDAQAELANRQFGSRAFKTFRGEEHRAEERVETP